MTTGSRSNGGRLLLEMASIVFAVVLGFAVTNWDASRRDRERAERALERIGLELDENLRGLTLAAPYYVTMSTRLDSIMREHGDGPVMQVDVPGWRGLSPPALRTASFRVATATGALENVPFDLADELAVAYDALDDFTGAVDRALGAVLTGDITDLSDWMAVFRLSGELAFAAERQASQALQALAAR